MNLGHTNFSLNTNHHNHDASIIIRLIDCFSFMSHNINYLVIHPDRSIQQIHRQRRYYLESILHLMTLRVIDKIIHKN